jgi:hypothetical protein
MGGVIDVEWDVPLDMTLGEWRRARRAPRRPRLRTRLSARLRAAA